MFKSFGAAVAIFAAAANAAETETQFGFSSYGHEAPQAPHGPQGPHAPGQPGAPGIPAGPPGVTGPGAPKGPSGEGLPTHPIIILS